jgi:epoxyqueuosine reductase
MLPGPLTESLKTAAKRLGFDLAGACPAVSPPGLDGFRQWLAAGYAGRMEYFARRAEAYEHPRHVLDGVRSLLVLAKNYRTQPPQPPEPGQGSISRYAWGSDYHDTIRHQLDELCQLHRQLVPEGQVRGVIDTAPLLERPFAQLAGLGWIGKNTLLLNQRLGSWFFLAVLLTSETLDYDQPVTANHCGTCRACLDACPTEALVAPYRLDSRRCISYLTIELREPIPGPLRAAQGQWLFGCDVCQEVCPWNHRETPSNEPTFQPLPGTNPVELAELLGLDEDAFRRRFRHTPLARPKRGAVLRSAAIALGNRPHPAARPALERGLDDPDPMVRDACAWALERMKDEG